MTDQKLPIKINSIELKNVGPFDNGGLTINFGEKKNPSKANIHILVGKNGSGKSTVLKGIFYNLARKTSNFSINNSGNSNSDFYFKGFEQGVSITTTRILVNSNHLLYTPNEPMIKQGDYNYIPKNRDDGNNIIKNWICYYPDKDYLDFIRKIENDRSEILANPQQEGDRKMTDQQINFLKSKIKFTEKLEKFVKDIYDIDFLYKRNNQLEWQPYIKGEFIDFNQLSLGYKQIISLITDILIKVWEFGKNLQEREKASFTLLLDEIDVHLHPQAQRRILPAIQKLFPNAEIFCTTHSPFVVNSVNDAWVYEISEENYLNDKNESWKSEDGKRFLNPVETNIFNSFDSVLIENFNVEDEYGTNNDDSEMHSAKSELRNLSEYIKTKNISEITKTVSKIRNSNNTSLKSRVEFELSKNNIDV